MAQSFFKYLRTCCAHLIVSAIVATAFVPSLVYGQSGSTTVDYTNILSDEELVANLSMSQIDIQKFLESKQSFLATYYVVLESGESILASDHIYRVSQTHGINPKFLLVLLQKEQSLVEETAPTPNQLDWATGYGCLDNQPCNERWRGFRKQVNSAAEQFRYYYEHIDEYNYQPGRAAVVDGQVVVPKNRVTAALYNYTPHLHGNALFRTLWDKYFATLYPDGILLQAKGEAGVWLVQDGVKRAFTSRLALVSRFNPDLVVSVASSTLERIPRGLDIEFPAYSILRGLPSGRTYLLTVDQKRHITSEEVFKTLGFNPEEVDEVSDDRLTPIPDGRPITLTDAHPTGTVFQDSKTGELYYVESGRKYPIATKDMLKTNYQNLTATKVSGTTLSKFATGFPILFREGTLIKGSTPEVYVVSNQRKRHITSEKAFTTIGYKWTSIIQTTDAVLGLHPTGEPIVVP